MAMRRTLRFCSIALVIAASVAVVASCQKRGDSSLLQTTFKGLNAERICVQHGAGKRCYYLVHPDGRQRPKALLLALHPAFHDIEALEDLSGIVRPVAAQPIMAIYPEGIDKQWNDGRHAEKAKTFREHTDDVAYLSLIVSDTQRRYGLSAKQTTVAGMSNGGMMALRLACETHMADKIISIVANLPTDIANGCQLNPKHMVLVFGTEDDVVPYKGGDLSGVPTDWGTVISALETETLFASLLECRRGFSAYKLDAVDDGTIVHKRDFSCAKGSMQTYHVEGMGHTWPNEKNMFQAFITTRGRISEELDGNRMVIDSALSQ